MLNNVKHFAHICSFEESFTTEHIFLLFFQNPRLLVQPPSKVDDDDMVRKVVTVAVVDILLEDRLCGCR